MRVEKHISTEAHFVLERVSGDVTETELTRKMSELLADPNYESTMRGICDFRKARPKLSRAEMDRFSRGVAEHSDFGKSRWAIVTDHPILNAYGHLLQRRIGADAQIRVFTTIEAAEEYVGCEVEQALSLSLANR